MKPGETADRDEAPGSPSSFHERPSNGAWLDTGRMTRNDPAWTRELLRNPHAVDDKSSRVRDMFNAIAPRYEQVNTLFSAGRDASWRRKAVALAAAGRDDDVLDIACGTGDFARAFRCAGVRRVVGCDFAHAMLIRAARRGPATGRFDGDATGVAQNVAPLCVEADALQLPFADVSFSIASCAFGVRNLSDPIAGFREMHRILRPGGRAVILEFSRPRNRLLRAGYEMYAARFMPRAASWISGDRTGAYRYLPRSVVSFDDPPTLCRKLEKAGFAEVRVTPLTWGVVTVYVAGRS